MNSKGRLYTDKRDIVLFENLFLINITKVKNCMRNSLF